MELSLELSEFTYVLQATFIELNLLIRHYPACLVALRCVVQALRHAVQYLEHLVALVMELVPSGNVSLEKQCDGLEEVVNVAESNVDVEAVLLRAIVRCECVLFVRLRCGSSARDLNQLCHFN